MVNKQSRLADFVRSIVDEKNLTYSQISKRAKREGYVISKPHVIKIVNNNVVPTVGKLEALAAGLGVDPEALFKAAIGRDPETNDLAEFRNIVIKIERMTGLRREVYKEYIAMLNDRLDKLANE